MHSRQMDFETRPTPAPRWGRPPARSNWPFDQPTPRRLIAEAFTSPPPSHKGAYRGSEAPRLQA